MREFDIYFLHHEVGELSDVITPTSTIVVCKELADAETLTLFSLNQALQYGSMSAIYFRTALPHIPTTELSLSDGRKRFLIDDLAEPAHIGLFAHRSLPPGLPRVSLSYPSTWASADPMEQLFTAIRQALRDRNISVNHDGLPVSVTTAAANAIAVGEATTGNQALDDLVTNKRR